MVPWMTTMINSTINSAVRLIEVRTGNMNDNRADRGQNWMAIRLIEVRNGNTYDNHGKRDQ